MRRTSARQDAGIRNAAHEARTSNISTGDGSKPRKRRRRGRRGGRRNRAARKKAPRRPRGDGMTDEGDDAAGEPDAIAEEVAETEALATGEAPVLLSYSRNETSGDPAEDDEELWDAEAAEEGAYADVTDDEPGDEPGEEPGDDAEAEEETAASRANRKRRKKNPSSRWRKPMPMCR